MNQDFLKKYWLQFGLLVTVIFIFGGVKLYTNYQAVQFEKEQNAQEQAVNQQKALEQAQLEIDKLKQETVQVKQTTTKSSIAGKNYNYILISSADSWVNVSNGFIEDAKKALSDVQDAINFANQQKEYFRVSVGDILQNEQLANLFMGEFDKEVAYYKKVDSYLNGITTGLNNNISLAQQFRAQATEKFYATEQATTQDAKTLDNEFQKGTSLYVLIGNTSSELLAYRIKRGQEYIAAMDMLRSAINASQRTTVVNNFVYSSPAPAAIAAIPTINYPIQQRCSVSPIGGGGVDLIVRCY